jgi:hypothetical protein
LIPAAVLSALRSKLRHEEEKMGFEDKLRILLNWTEGDPAKCAVAGLSVTPDGDYLVDCPILSRHFQIKERSLNKNFNLNDYHRVSLKEHPNLQLFRKRNHDREVSESMERIIGQLSVVEPLNWDSTMVFHWEKFLHDCPDRSVSGFCQIFGAKRFHFLSPSILLSFVVQSDTVSIELFQLIYEHFGPEDHLFVRLNNFCVSLFARGWGFGSGHRCVELISGGVFRFRSDDYVAELKNNFHELGYWYGDGEHRIDLETFFERHFPMEIASEGQLIDFVECHFPENLFVEESPAMDLDPEEESDDD